MNNHSKLPWQVEHDEEASASYIITDDTAAPPIAMCSLTVAGITKEEAMANAEFIAKSANSYHLLAIAHDALSDCRKRLEALRKVDKLIGLDQWILEAREVEEALAIQEELDRHE